MLFTNELFTGYIRKGMSARCVLKVDLRKVYDPGFSHKFIVWIVECITTVTYSLTVNGGLTKPFEGKKGFDKEIQYPFICLL